MCAEKRQGTCIFAFLVRTHCLGLLVVLDRTHIYIGRPQFCVLPTNDDNYYWSVYALPLTCQHRLKPDCKHARAFLETFATEAFSESSRELLHFRGDDGRVRTRGTVLYFPLTVDVSGPSDRPTCLPRRTWFPGQRGPTKQQDDLFSKLGVIRLSMVISLRSYDLAVCEGFTKQTTRCQWGRAGRTTEPDRAAAGTASTVFRIQTSSQRTE
jgi:hypothetical protein